MVEQLFMSAKLRPGKVAAKPLVRNAAVFTLQGVAVLDAVCDLGWEEVKLLQNLLQDLPVLKPGFLVGPYNLLAGRNLNKPASFSYTELKQMAFISPQQVIAGSNSRFNVIADIIDTAQLQEQLNK